ncbi:MAG: glycoside hydrolase family 43 protein [Clostridia bacterium]|nr:glycoside hydrolase family 43 protein [Clostridia bacterium]
MKKSALFGFAVLAAIVVMLFAAVEASCEEYYSITPGELWYDNNGGHIQAHGGCVLWDDNTQKYYWYGEARQTSVRPSDIGWLWDANERIGVSCYSSDDLYNWMYEGLALSVVNYYGSDLSPYRVIERPKVIYNDTTGKYVMWMHIDASDYSEAKAGVAVSDTPTGPFEYLYSVQPNGKMARDMTLFKDDDGTAYLYAAGDENMTLYCHKLTDDYLRFEGTYSAIFENWQREAPAVFKYDGKYFMVNSGCTGWNPNAADSAVAYSPMDTWYSKGNPCVGDNASLTFGGQSAYVLEVDRENGKYIFMADIWNSSDQTDSRYIWLPIEFTGSETFSITWQDEWRIDTWAEKTDIDNVANLVLNKGEVYRQEISASDDLAIAAVSGDTESVAVELEDNVLWIYALDVGSVDVTLRAGGGGYDGAKTEFTVSVKETKARAYKENNGLLLINVADALNDSEYAYYSTQDVHTWKATDTGLEVYPDIGDEWRDTSVRTEAPALYYRVYITNPGDYYVYLNTSHENISGNSLHIGVDGEYLFTSTGEDNLGDCVWLEDDEWIINFPSAGVYTINVWGREDGSKLNTILLSKERIDASSVATVSALIYAKQETYEMSGEEKIAADIKFNDAFPSVVTEDLTFTSYFGTSVEFEGGEMIASDGAVTRPKRGEGDVIEEVTVIYTADGCVETETLNMTVKENDGQYFATNNYDTVDIRDITGHKFISFDIAANEISDGIVAFCGEDVTPSDWSDYAIAFRIQPDATMDARNGSAYEATEEFTYEVGLTYHIMADVDVTEQKCNVYVTDYRGKTICVAKDFAFRCEASDIGKVTVRGGSGVESGLFYVTNMAVCNSGVRIVNAYLSGSKATADVISIDDGEIEIYGAFYSENGEMISLQKCAVTSGVTGIEFEAPEDAVKVRVMAREDDMTDPICESMARREGFVIESAMSSKQNSDAFCYIGAKTDFVTYTFTFVDNGSLDSGIMIGAGEYLNESSSNYFASGSIVILFADGVIYTRDDESKEEVAEYTVGEDVEVTIEANVIANTYDLYIDGVLVSESVLFRQSADLLDTLALVENNGGEMFEVKNFTVK